MPGVLGTVWLAFHLDERVRNVEELALSTRYGATWEAYARTTPRWLGSAGAMFLLMAILCCGLVTRLLTGLLSSDKARPQAHDERKRT